MLRSRGRIVNEIFQADSEAPGTVGNARSFHQTVQRTSLELPNDKWPICRQCNTPMPLFAHLQHHPERMDLGMDGRVLYLFICNTDHVCSTWHPDEGGNAVMILNRKQMTTGPACPPENSDYRELPL
jgi:hypothetical protein